MPYLTLNNFPVSAGQVMLPRNGRLTADLTLGTVGPPPVQKGQVVTLKFQDGTAYACAVERAAPTGGFSRVRLVGGNGRLSKSIPARYYEGIPAAQIVRDLLSECGEAVGEIDLPGTLIRWVRPAGLAHEALATLMLRYPERAWRVQPDGKVWVGAETWPEHAAPLDVESIQAEAGIYLADAAPDLRAGMLVTLRRGGEETRKRAVRVEHLIGKELRTRVYTGDGQDAGIDALSRLVGQATRFVDYLALFPATILKDHGDHRLDVRPEHPLLPDMVRVPLVPPVGSRIKVKAGGTVLVAFQHADPARPIVLHLVDVVLELLEVRTGKGQVLVLDDDRGQTSDEGVYAAPRALLRDSAGQGLELNAATGRESVVLRDRAGDTLMLEAAKATATLSGIGITEVGGALVKLAGGGAPVARVGDQVDPATHKIILGSLRVGSG